jgi:hypothetical protein
VCVCVMEGGVRVGVGEAGVVDCVCVCVCSTSDIPLERPTLVKVCVCVCVCMYAYARTFPAFLSSSICRKIVCVCPLSKKGF